MSTLPFATRRICLLLFLFSCALSRGQPDTSPTAGSLPARQAVTEGRAVSFKASGVAVAGVFQWQVALKGTESWVDLSDGGIYSGTKTPSLELAKVELPMDGDRYRFTVTDGLVRHASNALRLTVSPLLIRAPVGITIDEQGVLIVSDADSHAIWRVFNGREVGWGNDFNCPVGLIAGHLGNAGVDDGYAAIATFNRPGGIAGAGNGVYFLTDTANALIRRLSAGGLITTVAGSSTERGNADGPALAASFGAPIGIARSPDGSLYVADAGNHTLRKIAADGVVSTLAGSPGDAGFLDGSGAAARFNSPGGVAVDTHGRIYVADTGNNLIRTVSPEGVVQTLAGVAGVAGTEDGEGPAARFNGPTALAVTRTGGRVYIADTGNSTIRMIDASGAVSTYAGVPGVSGLRNGHVDYDAAKGRYVIRNMLLNQPRGLYDDGQGLLFIADTGNAAIRVISVYEDLAVSLPLVPLSADWSPPTVLPPPPSPTPLPSTGTVPPPSSEGGSGGGALGCLFLAIVAGLRLLAAVDLDGGNRRRD